MRYPRDHRDLFPFFGGTSVFDTLTRGTLGTTGFTSSMSKTPLHEAILGRSPVWEALSSHRRMIEGGFVGDMLRGQHFVDSITGGSNVFKTMERFGDTFRDLTERWRETFYAALPPNWQGLEEDEVEAIGDLMVETGWSLVWTPSLIDRASTGSGGGGPPGTQGRVGVGRRPDRRGLGTLGRPQDV